MNGVSSARLISVLILVDPSRRTISLGCFSPVVDAFAPWYLLVGTSISAYQRTITFDNDPQKDAVT